MNAGGVPNTCKSSGALFSTEHPVERSGSAEQEKKPWAGAHRAGKPGNAEEALGHGVLSAEQCLAADG
jgi:hypothetical protein